MNNCTECGSEKLKKFGKNKVGNQRYRCLACEKTFSVKSQKVVEEKIEKVKKIETEKNSIFDDNETYVFEGEYDPNRDPSIELKEYWDA